MAAYVLSNSYIFNWNKKHLGLMIDLVSILRGEKALKFDPNRSPGSHRQRIEDIVAGKGASGSQRALYTKYNSDNAVFIVDANGQITAVNVHGFFKYNRSLEPGEAIIADGANGRVFIAKIRPRLSAHGGNTPAIGEEGDIK